MGACMRTFAQRGDICKAIPGAWLLGGRHSRLGAAQCPRVFLQQTSESPSFFDAVTELFANIGWIDRTAVGVLLTFFVIGLFKGLVWQVSRILILVFAFYVSFQFGDVVAAWVDSTSPSAENIAGTAPAPPTRPDTATVYLTHCLLFLGMLVLMSLLSMMLQSFVVKAGLGFFNRVGGGLFGVVTGACVVFAGIMALHMCVPHDSQIVQAARKSHALSLSRRAIALLGPFVQDEVREAVALQPIEPPRDQAGAGTR